MIARRAKSLVDVARAIARMTMLKNHNDNDGNRAYHDNGNSRVNGENRDNGDNRSKRVIVGHTFVSSRRSLIVSRIFLSLLVVASSGIRTYVDVFYKILL